MQTIPDAADAGFGTFAPDWWACFVLGKRSFDRPRRAWPLWRKISRAWLHRTGRIFDIGFMGFRLRLHPATNAGDEGIVLSGIHGEEDEFERVAERVAGYENFIDIGANIGLYSLIAARNMPNDCPIIAFEPDPKMARRLKSHLAFNDAGKVKVIEAAVSPENGELAIFQPAGNAGCTSANKRFDDWLELKVPCVTLADALSGLGIHRIGMLKIDIEGFEDQALLPYLDTMPADSWPRYILIEVCHNRFWKRDTVAELVARGYREVYRNTRNQHFERADAT